MTSVHTLAQDISRYYNVSQSAEHAPQAYKDLLRAAGYDHGDTQRDDMILETLLAIARGYDASDPAREWIDDDYNADIIAWVADRQDYLESFLDSLIVPYTVSDYQAYKDLLWNAMLSEFDEIMETLIESLEALTKEEVMR